MSDANTCPQCGYAIPSGDAEPALAGLCPRCLAGGVGAGMTESDHRTDNARIPIETLRPPLKAGASFKGFEVLEVLGQGGMGVVYKARQQSLNRIVALKLLNSQLATSEEFAARFDREAKVLASLNHPNVVQVFDFGKEEGLLYLVMEHVDGPTLEDVLKKKGDPARFLAAVRDVAKGLERVHQAGLVHRDVKPSNILIAKDGTAKISDFGLAIETEGSQKLTQSGMFVGTPHYVSPEHAQGKKVDGRSDLYSLGVILFEGFAGRPPFQAPSATALLLKHVNEAPPALYKLAPQSPKAVQEIVRKLLAKNPAARHDTASSLVRDLDRGIEELKAPKVAPRNAPSFAPSGGASEGKPAPEPSKLPIKWIGAGVAAAAVIAIAAAVFGGKSAPPPPKEEMPSAVAVSRPAPAERKKEPTPEVAPPTPPPVVAPPAQDPVPVPPPPAPTPRTASAIEEAFREGEKLFEQARAAFEEGKARSSVEILTDAAFKADAAKAKYAAVQEIGTDELKAKAVEQVGLVQQFQKLVKESRLAILESKGVQPAAPAKTPENRPAALPPVPVPAPAVPAPAARRATVPNATALKDSEKQVRALFKEDYAKKAPADVQAFARKLLDQGATVSNDEVARFVMLRDSRDLASQAGDLETAMKAVDALSQSFEIEPVSTKAAAVNKAAPLMRGVDGMLLLSKAYLSILEEGIASGQVDAALAVAPKAEAAAKASNDVLLLSRIQTVSKDLVFLQRESASVRSALKTLEQKPDDPSANLSAGRFTCLGAGDWAKGLPMLAKGSDAALKAAAEKELARDDAAAGDAWWAAAEKERTAEYKRRMQARAARWYLSVLPDASGLAKLQMESRLKQVGGLLLPEQPAPQRTDLVGGPGGASYDDYSREGGVLIGVRMNWTTGSAALKAVQPLFSTSSSIQEGPIRGKPASAFKESLAKPGYAVGGVIARGTNRVNGLKIVYMRISGIGLDPRDSYESEWFGDRGPGETRLAGDGTYVLGICGGAYEEVDSMGLLTLRRTESRAASAPAAAPAKGAVDVLALIDPKLDSVEGTFAHEGAGLLTPPRVLRARVMVPYTPPAEYDFTMVVERREGVNSFNYGVLWGGKLISLVVDGKGPAVEDAAGMDFINGRPFFDNETLSRGPFLLQGKPSTIVTSLRKGSVTMTIDGRVVFSWQGDPSRVGENPAIAVPNKGAMSVGSYDASFLITQMTVTPVSGQGSFLRKSAAAPAVGAGTPAPKGSLDLLALVDPAKDAVEGVWSIQDKALVSQGGAHVRLMLPYVPPDEYDLRVVMERREGEDGVAFGLSRGSNQWTVYVDKLPSEGCQTGTELIDSQMVTAVKGPQITTGQPVVFEFKVRRNGFTVMKDGKLLYVWQGNTNRLSNFNRWQVPHPRALFLGQWSSQVRYTEVRVIPVSGEGTLLRGSPIPKNAIDLLALIDPQKDAVKGDWSNDGKGLICSAGDHIRLQIPYSPPEEYDLILTVDRRDGTDGLLVGLVKGTAQWSVTMDTQSSGSFKSGFESLDNQGPSGNATTYSGPVFANGVETTLEFRVRKVGVTVLAGGKPIIDWRGSFNRLSLPDGWKVKSPNALFLAAWGSRYHFSKIILVPVSGQGKKLR